MISLDKKVFSLKPARRLKELGVKPESLFWWSEHTSPATGRGVLQCGQESGQRANNSPSVLATTTVAALCETQLRSLLWGRTSRV